MDGNILAIVASEAVADWRFAEYVKTEKPLDWVVGYAGYGLALHFFIKSIKKKGLGWSNAEWDGWSNLATGAVSLFIMKERPSEKELLGMALISSGLFLLHEGSTKD
jgi:multidrug transporter EmrE-like cation transporter